MQERWLGIVFAIVHTRLYHALGLASTRIGWGIIFGIAHWVVAGMGMGVIGAMHPLMRTGQLQAPGLFVKNHPAMTVIGAFMPHLRYGLLAGALYELWS